MVPPKKISHSCKQKNGQKDKTFKKVVKRKAEINKD